MMKFNSLRTLPLLGAFVFVTGCSSLNPFASSAPKPAELVDFKPSAEMRVLWEASIGESVELTWADLV